MGLPCVPYCNYWLGHMHLSSLACHQPWMVACMHQLHSLRVAAMTCRCSSRCSLPALQLVVVSPLRRTLETAAGVFGSVAAPVPDTSGCQSAAAATATAAAALPATSVKNWVLMRAQTAKATEITQVGVWRSRVAPVLLIVVMTPVAPRCCLGCRF